MRELALHVPPEAVEDVFDRLLPLAPHGIHELRRPGAVELRLRGRPDELPAREHVAAAGGQWGASLTEREVPDDWRERRALDYEPDVIANRLVVRPAWAPPLGPEWMQIVLEERDGFGTGGHPTTRACLEELAACPADGSLADLGSGSGVLAIAAALLGFEPVVAIERDSVAADAVRANAAGNDVAVEVRELDLAGEDAPPADTVVANVPLELHALIARRMARPPRVLIASGLLDAGADEVAAAYVAAGLREARRRSDGGWSLLVLVRA